MARLDDSVALITGAAQGQGAAEARAFVDAGAKVVLGDVLVDECHHLAEELGENAVATRLDVTNPDDWNAAVGLAEERFGALHVLVNNAGIVKIAPLFETSLDEYRAVIEVNQTGCFLGMRIAGPAIARAGGGAIVNVSSTGGLEGVPKSIAYAASKHAVTGMTKTAAIELGRYGIRVNSVHPGGVDTPMLNLTDEARATGFAFLPLGRVADPAEIARVVVFLASDDSSYMTGSAVLVDGGSMAGPLGWNAD
jgi:3alpha(or 20beta)-hydroxysteroid dehydrogenase